MRILSLNELRVEEMRLIAEALIAKKVARHPDLNVNLSVVYCICEILRIMSPDTPYTKKQFKVLNMHINKFINLT